MAWPERHLLAHRLAERFDVASGRKVARANRPSPSVPPAGESGQAAGAVNAVAPSRWPGAGIIADVLPGQDALDGLLHGPDGRDHAFVEDARPGVGQQDLGFERQPVQRVGRAAVDGRRRLAARPRADSSARMSSAALAAGTGSPRRRHGRNPHWSSPDPACREITSIAGESLIFSTVGFKVNDRHDAGGRLDVTGSCKVVGALGRRLRSRRSTRRGASRALTSPSGKTMSTVIGSLVRSSDRAGRHRWSARICSASRPWHRTALATPRDSRDRRRSASNPRAGRAWPRSRPLSAGRARSPGACINNRAQ